ncbi:hypothetical protein, partial [Actinomyces sp. Z5]|uniref:hypothetical protein n=1 Tax=Actinomyces sp. Z5 TaxID=2250216 RepID=UPI001C657629
DGGRGGLRRAPPAAVARRMSRCRFSWVRRGNGVRLGSTSASFFQNKNSDLEHGNDERHRP